MKKSKYQWIHILNVVIGVGAAGFPEIDNRRVKLVSSQY